MNRKIALATVRAEAATYGTQTAKALRTYVENRISYAAFMEAHRAGLRIYQEAQNDE